MGFFTREEFATVAAITERIFPPDEQEPGAREAGVPEFIDRMLGSYHEFAEPTYRSGPYMQTYTGREPPARPGTVFVPEEEAERYGFQSQLGPQDIYRRGLSALDAFCRAEHGDRFSELEEEQQISVLEQVEDGDVDAFTDPSASLFFQVVYDHTIQGVFSDPIYGGNRGKIGWEMIAYPGAWRGYQPSQMQTEGFTFPEPVSLADAPHFHAGEPVDEHVVLPVQGSDRRRRR